MTNYESTSYHVVDEKGRSLAFSTVDRPGEEHVLRAWSTQELADGQLTELEVFFTEDDVRGHQAFLNDRYGAGRSLRPSPQTQRDEDNAAYFRSGWVAGLRELLNIAEARGAEEAVRWAYDQEPGAGENLPAAPAVEDIYLPAEPDYTPGPEVYGVPDYSNVKVKPEDLQDPGGWPSPELPVEAQPHTEPRRCPVIYNGVQCLSLEGHPQHHDFGAAQMPPSYTGPQTSDGAATPPVMPATPTPAGMADMSASAVAPADAAPSDAPKTRKRRTKLEMAFDRAKESGDLQAIHDATEALKAKDPSNERLSQIGASTPGAASPNPDPVQIVPNPQPPVRFADEPVNPFDQPMPIQPGSPQDTAGWQGQAPDGAAIYNPIAAAAQVSPQEQQAAQGFPCPQRAADGRQCVRPYGHELQTATNPEPKPHIYATDPGTLPNVGHDPSLHAAEEQFEQQHPSVPAQPAFTISTPQPAGFTPGGGAQILSFQTPPTPAQPVVPQGANLQPQAPAAPFLQPTPNGGQ